VVLQKKMRNNLSKTRIAILPINYFIHTTNFKTAEFEKAVTLVFIGSLSTGNRLY
jgi:hypothetical protein